MLRGLLRGFVREVFSLVGIVLGIWGGILYQPSVAAYLKSYLPASDYLPLVSFVSVFSLMVISCNLLGIFVKFFFFKIFKGGINRILGGSVAFIKGVVVTYLLMVMLTFLLPSKTPLIAGSKLAPFIIMSYQSMVKAVSRGRAEEWKERVKKGKDKAEEMILEKARE
ncbi:MAG: CvpA family protein [Deltaproteobacteria bacterium]|nr:CvpA family protein [Deltaproteobacteria bacterium]